MPFILIAAGVVGGVALVRLVLRESARINRELDSARRSRPDEVRDMPKLRRDPQTGTFRPG